MKAVNVKSMPNHGLGDVTNWDSTGSLPEFDAFMGMSMKGHVDTGTVDRLAEKITAQKRIDLFALAQQGVGRGRVMKERDAMFAG